MAEKLLELGRGLEIWLANLDELREQDVNARAMDKPRFERLAATVGRDARLESLPFCAATAKGIEIVSGHHRTRAARAAGVASIHVVVDVTGLSADQIRAKQLAHNAIQGEDNEQLIKQIYEAIGDVEQRLETAIDPAALGLQIEAAKVTNIDLGLEYQSALLVFLPYEKERFDRACAAVRPFLAGDYESRYLAELGLLEGWKKLLKRTGDEYDIKAFGTILERIASIVLEHLGQEERPADTVALRDLFGASVLPAEDAELVRRALAKLEQAQTVTKKTRWQALRAWAAAALGEEVHGRAVETSQSEG